MNFSDLWGHLFVALVGGLILGILGFLGWLWKKSIYGEFEILKKAMTALESELKREAAQVKLQAERDVAQAKAIAAEGIKEIKDTLRHETELIKTNFVPVALCNAERNGCQRDLIARINAINSNLGEKLDLVIQRQLQVINRIDGHINGHHKE